MQAITAPTVNLGLWWTYAKNPFPLVQDRL